MTTKGDIRKEGVHRHKSVMELKELEGVLVQICGCGMVRLSLASLASPIPKWVEPYHEVVRVLLNNRKLERAETLAAAIKVVEGIPSECGTAIIERAGTRFDEEDEPDDRLWHYLLMEETMKDVLAKLKEMGK